MTLEYTVHFQKGTRVGARSTRMFHVEATDWNAAVALAKREFNGEHARGYRLVRVDYFDPDTGRIVLDY
jgi:hypothetical protein